MWVTELRCDAAHRFEGFFPSRDAFEQQCRQGLVACPSCGSVRVEAALNAPRLNLGAAAPALAERPAPTPESPPSSLRELVTRLKAGSEDQGRGFAAEARAIHEGRARQRAIHGQASGEELMDLLDDGIAVLPLPDESQLDPPH